jgi:hypothetical protein
VMTNPRRPFGTRYRSKRVSEKWADDLYCHSERSEESLFICMETLRFAQGDKSVAHTPLPFSDTLLEGV